MVEKKLSDDQISAKRIGNFLGTIGFGAEILGDYLRKYSPTAGTLGQLSRIHGGNPEWSGKSAYDELIESGVTKKQIKDLQKWNGINYKKVRCVGKVRRDSFKFHEFKLGMTEQDLKTDGVYVIPNLNPWSSAQYYIGLEELANRKGHTWNEIKDRIVKEIDF